jgi:GTPase SAR1 family protein
MNVHSIFCFGLDTAGKKTLIKEIKSEEKIGEELSLDSRINRMILKDTQFEIWEALDITQFEDFWNQIIIMPKILLFVLDTSNPNRFILAKKQLDEILYKLDTNRIPLIFCFHKMDLEAAQENYAKARDIFKLHQISKRNVYPLQTSIKNSNFLKELRNQIVEIIEKLRWE